MSTVKLVITYKMFSFCKRSLTKTNLRLIRILEHIFSKSKLTIISDKSSLKYLKTNKNNINFLLFTYNF